MPARPEIRAFLSLCMFVLSVVILGDFAEQTWISRVFVEILLGRGQGNLKLKPKQKEALQAIVFERSRLFNCRSKCRINETSA